MTLRAVPPYAERVLRREPVMGLYYFEPEVLEKYCGHQEKYHFHDSVLGGAVATRDQYYLTLPEASRRRDIFATVDYGRRKLKGGGAAIAAFLYHLGRLPPKEQCYWWSFELEAPDFDDDDPGFQKWLDQELEGALVTHPDPIRSVYEAIRQVNAVVAPSKLFRREREDPNPHLVYPVSNTRKAYSATHKELRKLIGPDSIDVRVVKQLIAEMRLQPALTGDERPWALFKRLLSDLPADEQKQILEPLERSAAARSLDAHEIDDLKLASEDYVERFKRDCLDISSSLVRIAEHLTTLLSPRVA